MKRTEFLRALGLLAIAPVVLPHIVEDEPTTESKMREMFKRLDDSNDDKVHFWVGGKQYFFYRSELRRLREHRDRLESQYIQRMIAR